MPPKGKDAPSKKTEQKEKAKIIEDKTFGLKNKNKSTKVGKYIQSVETQVKSGGNSKRLKEQEEAKAALRERKRLEEEKKAELAALFKPVQAQKVAPGVDPKTVVCVLFKSGSCTKGDKCKFSHDLAVERKTAKLDVYSDRRIDDESAVDGKEDGMQDWDQSKLETVVQRKHKNRTTTEIVCKHFIEAIEKKSYGWFWECPNGGDTCKYRHALPPGFILRSTAAKKDPRDTQEEISLEEFLETERYRIEKKTPVTAETFAQWKKERNAKALAEEAAREKEKESQIRAGRMLHASGRDLFMYNPDLFTQPEDDDEEVMEIDYTQRDDNIDDGGLLDSVECENYDDQVSCDPVDRSAFLNENLEDLQIAE